jgi:broad specificity phosphatase PhoE
MEVFVRHFFAIRNEKKASFPEDLLLVRTERHFQEIPFIATSPVSYFKKNTKVPGVMRVIFVRHGESESNAKGQIAGQTHDSPLSLKGEMQAQATGRSLLQASVDIDAAFTSPMKRAKKTAKLILEHLEIKHDLIEDERIHERFYGPYEGASKEIVIALRKKEVDEISHLKTFAQKFAYKAHPEMESIESVYMRVSNFLSDTKEKYAEKTVLMAAHNGVLKSLVMAAAAMRGYDLEFRAFDLANCGIVVLEIDANGRIEVTATDGLSLVT